MNDFEKIRQYVLKKSHNRGRSRVEIDGDTPLIENQIIDSFAAMELTAYLEDAFNVRIPHKEVNPENFKSINTILALIQSRK